MATTFEQTTAKEGLTLEEKVAVSCGLSLEDAEKEIDCVLDNLRADIRHHALTYGNIIEELAGLGLEGDDENIGAILSRVI